MFSPAQICIIIPTFNEGAVLLHTLRPLLARQYQIVLVDDASTDDTPNLVADLPIHYLRHSVNLGQGAALQSGMDYAKGLAADYFVHFDADGQHNPDDIDRLVERLIEAKWDICLGSRFLGSPQHPEMPLAKKVVLKGAIVVNALFTGLWLTDAHNGFRVMNRAALTQIRLQESGMSHATEILSEIKRYRLAYGEEGVNISYNSYARAKGQSVWNAFSILSDLIVRKIFPL